MTEHTSLLHPSPELRTKLSKVPEITVYFWLVKVLCTTVGETFADNINTRLGDNLTKTTVVMGSILIVSLIVQFRVPEYIPVVYWVAVVLLSVVGTLITDNMVENFNVSLTTSTIIFATLMLATFGAWYASEKTLSIHSIHTLKREAFYWTAILFTFALGTAAGDLVAEKYNLGYGKSVVLFAGLIALVALAFWKFKLNGIFAFWAAYVLTRPLGASIGDLFSQPRQVAADADAGTGKGFGFGTTGTSVIFLGAIVVVVILMTIQQRRQPVLIDESKLQSKPTALAPPTPD
jgi:uncharacterized membrane-anchored protein